MNKDKIGFVGYEYAEITTQRRLESVYADSYPSFGWELEGTGTPPQGNAFIALRFKRDRKIRNKLELTRLQRQFECCVDEIKALERSKVFQAAAIALAVGLAGTVFMALAVFCFIAGNTAPDAILAIPGLLGWVTPYLLYRSISAKKSATITPLIDQKYNEICAVCERASQLTRAA